MAASRASGPAPPDVPPVTNGSGTAANPGTGTSARVNGTSLTLATTPWRQPTARSSSASATVCTAVEPSKADDDHRDEHQSGHLEHQRGSQRENELGEP